MAGDRQINTVLVTGASSGIGRSTSLYLAERGYTVIATSRAMARLEGLLTEASAGGLAIHGVELDINVDDQVDHEMRLPLHENALEVSMDEGSHPLLWFDCPTPRGLWGQVGDLHHRLSHLGLLMHFHVLLTQG